MRVQFFLIQSNFSFRLVFKKKEEENHFQIDSVSKRLGGEETDCC